MRGSISWVCVVLVCFLVTGSLAFFNSKKNEQRKQDEYRCARRGYAKIIKNSPNFNAALTSLVDIVRKHRFDRSEERITDANRPNQIKLSLSMKANREPLVRAVWWEIVITVTNKSALKALGGDMRAKASYVQIDRAIKEAKKKFIENIEKAAAT